ncbi:transposase [Anaerotignum sp.]|uniref:transposase n=1 Tax=Anaerotignum sp. TaxID=2039241 RepID=UPI003FA4847B
MPNIDSNIIVFTPKYKRKAIYKGLRIDLGVIARKLCENKAKILETQAYPDHIYISLYLSAVQFIGK